MTECLLVDTKRYFGGFCSFHLQGPSSL